MDMRTKPIWVWPRPVCKRRGPSEIENECEFGNDEPRRGRETVYGVYMACWLKRVRPGVAV